jgi:PhnB protein
MKINSYLTFNGNCREAMTFYKNCFGGELFLQTIAGSPLSEKMPERMRNCILHSTLTKGNLLLMGSDMVAEEGLIRGNAVSLSLECDSEEDIHKFYSYLSQGGQSAHSVENTFWGALFGDLIDKFGNRWLLHFDKNKNKTK